MVVGVVVVVAAGKGRKEREGKRKWDERLTGAGFSCGWQYSNVVADKITHGGRR